MPLLVPKLIALDSSHLSALSHDHGSRDPARRAVASAFLKAFDDAGYVLFLCWHHIEELLRHLDDSCIEERFAFFRSLPLVGCVSSFAGDGMPGSIVDVLTYEVEAAFRDPLASAQAIRDKVAQRIVRCEPGRDAIMPFLAEWPRLKEAFRQRQERGQEIVAISRSSFADIAATRVADWLKGKLRSPEDIARRLTVLSKRLTSDIQQRGDKRIADAERSAIGFLDNIAADAATIISHPTDPAREILQALGIELSDITPDTTMGEIGELAAFLRRLQIVSKNLGVPWAMLKSSVTESRVPSGVIQSGLRQYRQDLPEWKGSDLTDSYLACLSPYADVIYVDKRTHENFKRARQRSPGFAALVGKVEKAGNYPDILAQLSRTNGRAIEA